MSDQPVDEPSLPALRLAVDNPSLASLQSRKLPISLQLLLNPQLFAQVQELAKIMSGDTVFTPAHLRGKPQACHTVVSMALTWALDPHFTARCTYMTPGGSIGFEGKLVQAILEQSNRFVGAAHFDYVGDWTKVTGKFGKKVSQKGNEFVTPAWTQADAEGCGITIRWRVRGEDRDRVWPSEDMPFFLTQCFPLNSPLWATDPRTQIRYLAIRRFADQAAPGILSGMPFDPDDLFDASERAVDITNETAPPRPTRESVAQPTVPVTEVEPEPEHPPYAVTGYTGDTAYFDDPKAACEDWFKCLDWADKAHGTRGIQAVWESNSELYATLDENSFSDLSSIVRSVYEKRHEAAMARERLQEPAGEPGATPPATPVPPTEQAPTAPPQGTAPTGRLVPRHVEDIPFPDDGPAQPRSAPMGLGVPQRDAIWDGDDLGFEPPQIRGHTDWTGYTNRMRRLVAETRDGMELDALFKAQAENLTGLSTAQPNGYLRLTEEVGAKNREFDNTEG